jgi:hypothetical protein
MKSVMMKYEDRINVALYEKELLLICYLQKILKIMKSTK